MLSIFLGEKKNRIASVYTEEQTELLQKEANLKTDIVISSDNIESHRELAAKADYAFSTWGIPGFTREQVAGYFPNLKGVFYAAGSVAHFARAYLDNNIKVYSAWAANAVPVAEYAAAQIILANKCYYSACFEASRGRYEKAYEYKRMAPGNYGVNVGILGAGMIGRRVIRILSRCKMNIIVFDPFLPDDVAAELGVEKAGLDEVFARCGVVSNHLANKPETVGIIGYKQFSLMPKPSTFINTGRGAQVAEPDLVRYLTENPECCAVLDVTYPEPPEPESRLYKLNNVFITPHIAGSLGNETYRMAEYMVEEFRSVISGKPVRYEVAPEMLKTMA